MKNEQEGRTESQGDGWIQPGDIPTVEHAYDTERSVSSEEHLWSGGSREVDRGLGREFQNQTRYQAQPKMKEQSRFQKGMPLASLIMGALSVVSCSTGFVSFIFSILGILFSILSKEGKGPMDPRAKTGLILSCVGIGLKIIMILFVLFAMTVLMMA